MATNNDWFPTDGILPDAEKKVLLYFPNGSQDVGYRMDTDEDDAPDEFKGQTVWFSNMCGVMLPWDMISPTHWRPLPQPPKNE